ncbi:PaaX family transcriptional regulator [Noviherbaspirillum galbum]|uniref:PaaX family transcriptional regulator n=1 Tax=Noviherbaspirillum galbum TaxID=2709383 RepID=A0A6B3SM80_9BURK|nr:PaaX family transcriptional regulator [Noviherbaspirillum galbum]NEX59462.1 PaaX family transcriptional regulator [Noviherbaspirillum galbum]
MTNDIFLDAIPAPDLMLDLLTAHEQPLSARALCRSAEVMGIEPVAARVALTRLLGQKKISQPKRGCYAINRAAGGLRSDIDDWRKEARTVSWNGAWVAVHDAAVARSDKPAWRHHRLALSLRGFAEFKPSLQVRPDNLRGGVSGVREQLVELGLSPSAIVFRMTELDQAALASAGKLWNTEALAREYRTLTAMLDRRHDDSPRVPREQQLRESMLLGRHVIARLIRDPLLPPEIMPQQARQALVRAMTRYGGTARRLWQEFIAETGG